MGAERPDAGLAEVASAAGVSPRHVRRLIATEPDSHDQVTKYGCPSRRMPRPPFCAGAETWQARCRQPSIGLLHLDICRRRCAFSRSGVAATTSI
ncbi:hypothetical protein C1I95_08520 [Micromonospora craterilacus]|uniref:Uncharacterized protein n=1 Tax=Micromonospora craterilacus TaxID=1655439 RepID=A0A2W2EVM4_9ACTN|nr:hypothetical protein C1I95_08520 [Micromonospora craterilacus]